MTRIWLDRGAMVWSCKSSCIVSESILSTPTYYSIWVMCTASPSPSMFDRKEFRKKQVVVTTKRNFWKKETLYQCQGPVTPPCVMGFRPSRLQLIGQTMSHPVPVRQRARCEIQIPAPLA